MPSWNMFSPEVSEERRLVRAYGLDHIQNRVPEPRSYKGQALRQLAMRLELESKVKEMQKEINQLDSQKEQLELDLYLEQNKKNS